MNYWTFPLGPSSGLEPEPGPDATARSNHPAREDIRCLVPQESYQEECHETELGTAFDVETYLNFILCIDRACVYEREPSCTECALDMRVQDL